MKGIKIGIAASFVLAVATLAATGLLYQRYQAEKSVRDSLETENLGLRGKNDTLQSQISKFQEETGRLRDQIKGYVDQRESLKKELEEVNFEKARLSKRVSDLESEKNTLADRVNAGQVRDEALTQEADELAAVSFPAGSPPPLPAPASAPAPAAAPVKPAAPVEKKEAPKPVVKEAGASERPKKVEQEKEKAKPTAQAPAVEDQRPDQVLSVNRKFNFVVVNMGLRNRLKIGDTLRVEQNGKLIGRIQIEKLYENFSACTILEEIKPAQIQEGDLVRIA